MGETCPSDKTKQKQKKGPTKKAGSAPYMVAYGLLHRPCTVAYSATLFLCLPSSV